ncbi:MAG: hypothetical protein ABI850_09155, partial [Flavobacterium sp.]
LKFKLYLSFLLIRSLFFNVLFELRECKFTCGSYKKNAIVKFNRKGRNKIKRKVRKAYHYKLLRTLR